MKQIKFRKFLTRHFGSYGTGRGERERVFVRSVVMETVINKFKEFIENEAKFCSMDIAGMTPLYVY